MRVAKRRLRRVSGEVSLVSILSWTQPIEERQGNDDGRDGYTKRQYVVVRAAVHDLSEKGHTEQDHGHTDQVPLEFHQIVDAHPFRDRNRVVDKKLIQTQRNDVQHGAQENGIRELDDLHAEMVDVMDAETLEAIDTDFIPDEPDRRNRGSDEQQYRPQEGRKDGQGNDVSGSSEQFPHRAAVRWSRLS